MQYKLIRERTGKGAVFSKKSYAGVLVLLAVLSLAAVLVFVPASADGATNLPAAVGNEIKLTEDTRLSYDFIVPTGITLRDDGFSLTIPAGVTLTVQGAFISTGSPYGGEETDPKGIFGSIIVGNGGNVEFNGDSYNLDGEIQIKAGGSATIGAHNEVKVLGTENSKIIVEGNLNIGTPAVEERTVSSTLVAGSVDVIRSGSLSSAKASGLVVLGIATIGEAPTAVPATINARVSGNITLVDSAYLLAYGDNPGLRDQFTTETKITDFKIMNSEVSNNTLYAVQYVSVNGSHIVVYPDVDSKAFELVGWFTESSLKEPHTPAVMPDVNNQTIYGKINSKKYNVSFSYNAGADWTVNNVKYGTSDSLQIKYGDSIKVNAEVLPGYAGTPVFNANGSSYAAGSPFIVADDTVFSVSGIITGPREYKILLPNIEGYHVNAVSGYSSPVLPGASFSFTITVDDGYSMEGVNVLANKTSIRPTEGIYTISDINSDQTVTLSTKATVVIESDSDSVVFQYKVDKSTKQYNGPFQVERGTDLTLIAIPTDGGSVVWPDGSRSMEYKFKAEDVFENTNIVVKYLTDNATDIEKPESDPISPIEAAAVAFGAIIAVLAIIQLRARRL